MSLETFDWKPRRAKVVSDRWNVLETTFESGRKQYRSKGKKPRIFVLRFEKQNMHSADPEEIVDFFNNHQGKLIPFKWVYKGEDGETEELTVRFNQNSLDRNVLLDTVYAFTLEFIESLWE